MTKRRTLRDDLAFRLIQFANQQTREQEFDARAENVWVTADAILAMIHDALLSEPSLQAAGRVRLSHRGAADIMIAALDAVTGDGQ